MSQTSTHRIRRAHLFAWTCAALVLTSAGIGLSALALLGEVAWWSVLVGGLLFGMGVFLARELPSDWSVLLTVNSKGLEMRCRGATTALRWEEVTKLNFVVRQGEVVGMVLAAADGRHLTLGEDLTGWDSLRANVSSRLGGVAPEGGTG